MEGSQGHSSGWRHCNRWGRGSQGSTGGQCGHRHKQGCQTGRPSACIHGGGVSIEVSVAAGYGARWINAAAGTTVTQSRTTIASKKAEQRTLNSSQGHQPSALSVMNDHHFHAVARSSTVLHPGGQFATVVVALMLNWRAEGRAQTQHFRFQQTRLIK